MLGRLTGAKLYFYFWKVSKPYRYARKEKLEFKEDGSLK